VSVLGPISASKRLHQPDHLTTLLEARFDKRQVGKMRQKGVSGDEDVAARNKHAKRGARELTKEISESQPFILSQDREAGKRAPLASIEGWGNSPYTATSVSELLLLDGRVFLQTVWRISDNCMNRVARCLAHPV